MTQLSIVIPATGSQPAFDQTLVQVLENRPSHCEVIVPHAADYVDPYDLGDEVRFVSSEADDFLALMNDGIQASVGEIIHTLQSGVNVAEGWTDAAINRLEEKANIDAVAPLLLDPERPQRVLAAGIRYRQSGAGQIVSRGKTVKRYKAKLEIDGPLLQAGFYRRDVFETVGLLRPEFGEAAGSVDLAARLQAAQLECVHVSESTLIGWPLYEPRGYTASRAAERMFWQHRRESDNVSLVAHGMNVCFDLLRHLPNPNIMAAVAGRTLGVLVAPFQRSVAPTVLPSDSPATLEFDAGCAGEHVDSEPTHERRRSA